MGCSTDVISRLSTSFKNLTGERDKPDYMTRDIGGQFRSNQPYISGYFQVIVGLPEILMGGDTYAQASSKWLHSTVEGFTPHSIMINKGDIIGQGGIGSSFPVNSTVTREFGLTFREYQNMPIINILRRWNVFDPFSGVSALKGNEFIPENYKGWCAILQTKPVGANDRDLLVEDLEEVYVYQGVFPTSIPIDTAAAEDVNANDFITLQVQFSFDNHPLTSSEPGVVEQVLELLKGLRYIGGDGEFKGTFCRYLDAGKEDVKPWGTNKNTNIATSIGQC